MAAMAWLEGETVEYYSPTQEGWVLAAVWEVVPRGYVLHFPRSDDRVFRTLARALGVGEEYRFCVAAQRQFYEMEKPAAVRLAKQRDYPLLSNLEGCIVLSTQGDRSEHDKMYGSDYDGDKAIIITNLACVPSQPTPDPQEYRMVPSQRLHVRTLHRTHDNVRENFFHWLHKGSLSATW